MIQHQKDLDLKPGPLLPGSLLEQTAQSLECIFSPGGPHITLDIQVLLVPFLQMRKLKLSKLTSQVYFSVNGKTSVQTFLCLP